MKEITEKKKDKTKCYQEHSQTLMVKKMIDLSHKTTREVAVKL